MKGKAILIVEDELLISRHIEQMVKNLGYQSAGVVESAELALEKVKQSSPDLVLMDIRLKGEMNGIEAASIIWNKFSIPVVYLTAYADEDTLIKATSAEPFGYLLKPFEEKELLVAIELALYKHQVEIKNREQRRWLNAILTSITDGVLSTDAEGFVNFLNPVGEKLLEKTLTEVKGRRLEEIFLVREGLTGKIEGLDLERLKLGFSADQDFYLVRNSGNLPVELKSSVIQDENNLLAGLVLVFRDITQRKIQEERLSYLAIHDALTGLPNRMLFNDRLKISLEQARRKNLKVGLIMLDLDFFKLINDTYGHSFGDLVLIEAGKRLKEQVRKVDTLARFGGDEFTVLLSELNSEEGGFQVAQRIIHSFNQPLTIESKPIKVTASLGLAIFPDDAEGPEDLLKKADLALYTAKEAGRNQVKLFSEL